MQYSTSREQPTETIPTNGQQTFDEYINSNHRNDIGAFGAVFDGLIHQQHPQITGQRQERNMFDIGMGPYQLYENTQSIAQTHEPSAVGMPYMYQHELPPDLQTFKMPSNYQGRKQPKGRKRSSGTQIRSREVSKKASTSQETSYDTFQSRTIDSPTQGTFESSYLTSKSIDNVKSKPFKLRIPLSNSFDSYSTRNTSNQSKGSRSYSTRAFSESSYSKGSSSYSNSYTSGSFSENSRSSDSSSYTSYTSSTESHYDSSRQSSRKPDRHSGNQW